MSLQLKDSRLAPGRIPMLLIAAGLMDRAGCSNALGSVERETSRRSKNVARAKATLMRGAVLLAVLVGLLSWTQPALAQINVTTQHYDNSRTGQNTQETILKPSNVNTTQFGKLFSVTVDGYVYAQPLYMFHVNVGGVFHNVVYVATEHDSVYAFDADNGNLLWHVSYINPGAGITTVSPTDVAAPFDLIPEIGITGTPVIDPVSGTLYVVVKTKENGTFVQRLHALNISTGADKSGSPVVITGSVPGTGDGSVGGTLTFDAMRESNRPALLLQNGHVIIAWASHEDASPFHGWVMSYNAATLAREAVYSNTPNGGLGGIWMSGSGLAADSSSIYFSSGNGTYDGITEFGDTVMKIGQPASGTFPVSDWFTPFDQSNMNSNDLDLGSGGVVLLPDQPAGSPHQHLLLTAGKTGTIYLIDRDNMGHFNAANNGQVVQTLPASMPGIWGTPAWWNNNAYFGGTGEFNHGGDHLKAFHFDPATGQFSAVSTSQSSTLFQYSGTTPSVSANGNTNGIVWALQVDDFNASGPAVLHAYDATNLATELYSTLQNTGRDTPGPAVKFSTPTIANGKVYVGTQNQVSVYGLLNPPALVSIAVTPANPSIAGGATQQFTATGTYDDASTQNLTDYVTWSSSSTARATIGFGGLATGVSAGNTTIQAALNSVTGSTTLTVTPPPLVSIAVTPSNPSILTGGTQQFIATATYNDNSTQDITSSVTWSSNNTSAATINSAGAALGVGAGSATIQASLNSVNGSTTITVTGALAGPVGHWAFDSTAGTVAADTSGNGYNGTLFNGVSWISGKISGAISANNTNQYGSTPTISLSTTTAVTVAMWVNRTYTTGGANGTTLLELSSNFNNNDGSFGFFPDEAADCGTSAMEIGVRGNAGYNIKCFAQPTSGVWHHIAVVFDMSQPATGEVNLYIDGALKTALSQTFSNNNTGTFGNYPLYIFSRGGTASFSGGQMDDLQMYGRALSASEIQTLFNNVPADFILGSTPGSQTVQQGSSTTYTPTVTATGGFNGPVTWSVSGLPAGATGSFNPPSVTSPQTSTLTVSTLDITPIGTFNFTITGTSGSEVHTTTATLVVTAGPNFTVTSTPASRSVIQGAGTTYTPTVTPSLGFNNAVNFSVGGLPNGATGTFSPTSVPGTGTSTLTVTTSSSTPTGTYTLTITGTSGDLIHSTTATLVVSAAANFTVSLSPALRSVVQGTGSTYTPTVAAVGGFTGVVTFSVSGLPNGATGTFSPNTVTTSGSSTLTVNTLASTPAGNYTLTVTGTSGSLVHTATTTLVVNTPAPSGYVDVARSTVSACNEPAQTCSTFVHAGIPAGEAIMIIASWGGSTTTATIDDGVNTYTTVAGPINAAAGTNREQVWLVNSSAGTVNHGTITLSAPSAGAEIQIWVIPMQGIATTSPVDANVTHITTGAGTSMSTGTSGLASTSANEMIWGIFVEDAYSNPFTPAAGFTSISGQEAVTLLEYKNVTQTGIQSATGTNSIAANNWIGLIIGLKTTGAGITPTLSSIAVTPASPSIVSGTTQQFTATGIYSDNSTQDLTNSVTWTSSTSAATIASGGLATGASAGTSTIQATSGTVSGSTILTVTGTSTPDFTMSASPASQSILQGAGTTFTTTVSGTNAFSGTVTLSVSGLPSGATGTFNPPSVTGSGTSTLSVSTPANSPTGTFPLTITGTSGALTHTTGTSLVVLNTSGPTLLSIAVTPSSSTLLKGSTQAFTATGTYSDASTQNLTGSVAWTSTNPSAAKINGAGLVSALAIGSTTIQATVGSVTGSTSLTVATTLSGLAAHWTFDEGTGTAAADSSANGYNATLFNGVTWTNGEFAGAISADNVSQYASTPAINLSAATAVTASMWVNRTYTSGGTNGTTLFEFSNNINANTGSFALFPDEAPDCGTPAMEIGIHGNAGFNIKCFAQPTSGVWHHLAVVFDVTQPAGSELNLYIDGVLQTALSQSHTADNAAAFGNFPLYLFSRAGTASFSGGKMDDFQLYSRALSASEIQALFNESAVAASGVSVSPTSLNFGNQNVSATSAASPITVSSTGVTPLVISNITATGDFALASNTCTSAPMATSATCSLGVTFTPTAPGARTGSVIITSNDPASPLTLALSGTGVAVTPDFTMSNSPATRSVTQGASTTYTPAVAAVNAFSGNVTFSVSGLPTGATATFNPTSVAGAGTSTMTVTTGPATPTGTSTLTITGTSGSLTHSTTTSLTVLSSSGPTLLSIAVTPSNSSLLKGSTQAFTATGTYSNASTQNLTGSVVWSSSTPTIATINGGTGLVTAVSPGSTTIQATLGSVSGSTSLTVSMSLPGLAARWAFDEGTGTAAADSSANGYNATLFNGVTWTTGKFAGAISADNVSQYASTPAINLTSTTAVTASVWVNRTYTSGGTNGNTLFESSANYNSNTGSFALFPDEAPDCGTPAMEIGMRGDAGFNIKCFAQPTSGVWHHLAVVYDATQAAGNEVNLYIDGVLQTALSQSHNSDNTAAFGNFPLYLFSRAGTSSFSGGKMDDFQLYSRALSASEIQALYNESVVAVSGASASPNSLTFGSQAVNTTSAPLTLTLTSVGASPLNVSDFAITGDFSVPSGTCTGDPMPTSASCTFSVAFTPTASGTRTGSLSILTDDPASPLVISLSGTGAAVSRASASPNSLTFGSQAVNTTSAPLTLTLTSVGASPLNVSDFAITGDFSVPSGTCTGDPMPTSASCTFSVAFTPTASGTRTGSLSILTDDPASPLVISLSGTGAAVSRASASPNSLTFGSQAVNTTSAPLTLTLTSVGASPLNVSDFAITGDFSVPSGTCTGDPMPTSASCTFSVAFTPTASGTRTGSLSILTDDPASPLVISLSGTGAAVSRASASPNSLTFGSHAVNTTSAPLTLTLTSVGASPLNVSDFAITGDFSVPSGTCTGDPMPTSASCTFSVAFTPTASGTRTGSLSILTDDPASPLVISLSGTGAAVSRASASPNSLTFGSHAVNTTSAPLTLTLTSVGASPLNVSDFAITGDFSVPSGTCTGDPMPTSASCTFSVAFTPTASGTRTGSLSILTDDPASPLVISLSGTGAAVSRASASPNSLTFGSHAVNTTSAPLTLTLTSVGASPLNVSDFAITGDFSVPSGTCTGDPMPTSASCTFSVAFTPTASGTRTGSLSILTDDPASPLVIQLSGSGQ